MTSAFTLIDGDRAAELPAFLLEGRVRIAPDVLRDGLGWQLKPEGLCRGATCLPVRDRDALVGTTGIDLEALAGLLGRPLALDVDEQAGVLGTAAAERAAGLRAGIAPDFELPDLDGRPHRLSDQRGRKVLLIAYASW